MRIFRKRLAWLAALSALAAAGVAALPVASQATTAASVTLSAGSLAFINSTPAATVTFPATTLNGTNQAVTFQPAADPVASPMSNASVPVTA